MAELDISASDPPSTSTIHSDKLPADPSTSTIHSNKLPADPSTSALNSNKLLADLDIPASDRLSGSISEPDDIECEKLLLTLERTQRPPNLECPIFSAPAHIRYERKSDFEPKLVSIGPYYHGRENLKPMEKLKFRCMADLLKKHPEGSSNIHLVPVKPFIEVEKYARVFYKEEFDLSTDNFVEMLVLDSCFIIRIILSLSQEVKETMAFLDVDIKEVRSDLLLLENQIPLFFIEKVYDWLFTDTDRLFPPFRAVLEPFICLDIPWRINHDGMSSGAAHLLDLYWRCSSPPSNDIPSDELTRAQRTWAEIHLAINASKVIPNATTLNQMSYIKFEKLNHRSHHNDGLKVVFSNGILRMPWLKIDSSQTTLLVNLIAFENSKVPRDRIFSSYMKLMDALIDSEKDVELLQQCGVIYNTLSSHEMAATFFNDIGNFCLIDYNDFIFSDLYKKVQRYYDSIWNQRSASLKQNYFSNPWMGLSVVAGGTLLILSALQTFYTIYDHYNPKKFN